MNTDSRIAEIVIERLTAASVPVLCIHDSFVVDYRRSRLLIMAMTHAVRVVLGRDVALAQNYLGYDQVSIRTPELLDDYIEARRLERSAGYQARKRVFEERMIYLDGGRESEG